jgi:hypothetical protein
LDPVALEVLAVPAEAVFLAAALRPVLFLPLDFFSAVFLVEPLALDALGFRAVFFAPLRVALGLAAALLRAAFLTDFFLAAAPPGRLPC